MPKQNKTVSSALSKKKKELEDEIIGDVLVTQKTAEGPRVASDSVSSFDTKTGFRRRHPANVLNQYKGLVNTSADVHSVWEQSMEDEDSKAYSRKQFDNTNYGITNQFGLEQVAEDNFYKRKKYLETMRVVGV